MSDHARQVVQACLVQENRVSMSGRFTHLPDCSLIPEVALPDFRFVADKPGQIDEGLSGGHGVQSSMAIADDRLKHLRNACPIPEVLISIGIDLQQIADLGSVPDDHYEYTIFNRKHSIEVFSIKHFAPPFAPGPILNLS
jgi:hypothetical protein